MELTNQTALVTGSTAGIGRACARLLADEGAAVFITGRDLERGRAAAAEIGSGVRYLQADMSDLESVTSLVRQVGAVDILVNNAAFQNECGGIAEITTEQFDRTLKTNLYAMFWLCKAALPVMPPGGSIINTASVQASKPSPSLLDYATTKGGIVAFTQALAQEAIERGVRVNCVAPGPVWTPLIPSTMSPDEVRTFGTQSPMGRPAQPAELAPVYVFLASQESSYVNGARIAVTGGTPVP
jgi:NAD(P)-dependent dehydrogenase (short-subunit alcohol dehydrogenase family)